MSRSFRSSRMSRSIRSATIPNPGSTGGNPSPTPRPAGKRRPPSFPEISEATPTPGCRSVRGSPCPFTNSNYGFRCVSSPTNEPNCNINSQTSGCVSNIPSNGTSKGYICPSADSGKKNALKANIYYNGCYDSSTYSSTGSGASCGTHSNCSCTGNGAGKVCATNSGYYEHIWRQPVTPAGQVTAAPPHSTWNGCVTDRGISSPPPGTSAGYDQDVTAPTISILATLFTPEQYSSCPQAMMGLSYDWTAMNTLVTNMVAAGTTNQPIGLVWGWQTLVGGGPFTAPAMDPNYKYQQVIILLSDGLNTEDRWYSSQSSIDKRMYDSSTGKGTCANFKAASTDTIKNVIYTIQVNTGGDPTSTLLQNCASNTPGTTDHFYLLTSADQILTIFNQIGTALTQLRIAY